jgi:hypothetical protein
MKALLVAETDYPVRKITGYVTPLGFDVIRYRSAVKALDNIEEIMPDAVFISASDFPRHWKTLSQFIRADTGKDKTLIILLTNERFTADDADKAATIGVQAIIGEDLERESDERRLADLLARYRDIRQQGTTSATPSNTLSTVECASAVFLFTNPLNDAIITGTVESLSTTSIAFRPDAPAMVAELAVSDILEMCSLKLGDKILSPKCRIQKTGYVLGLEMVEPGETITEAIKALIA